MSLKSINEVLPYKKIEITDDALYEIAKISDGGMRDSINLLDQVNSYKNDETEKN